MKTALFVFLSFLIVAFGQPGWIPWLSPLSACVGYALFWREVSRFWVAAGWFTLVQAVQLSWMTSIEFQGIYILFVYAGICLWLGLQFGALTFLMHRIPMMASAAIWTLFEWARLHVLCGFSWNPLGLSLTAYLPSLQFASIFGVLGLSFWVVLTNLAAWKSRRWEWAFLALVPYVFGAVHLRWHGKQMEESPKLSVALVQTGLLPSEKLLLPGRGSDFISPFDQWNKILTTLATDGRKFDLVVLPEYAVPFSAEAKVYPFEKTKEILEHALHYVIEGGKQEAVSNSYWLQEVSNRLGAEVVAGLDSSEGKRHFAAAFHFSPGLKPPNRYEKRVLVPLAEYIPFSWLRYFTQKYGIIEFFTHGKEAKVFSGKIPLSISVCYEETFSHLMREGRKNGGELFVNVTNDNWYPNSKLPKQHFDHAKIRTVENGVPLVRACNTGITAAVDSLGRLVGQIVEERKSGVLAAAVPTYTYATLYTFWGDWGIVALCLFSLCACSKHLACWK